MIADALIVAVLLVTLDRIARGVLLNWVRTLKLPWAELAASRPARLVALCAVFSMLDWAQAFAIYGPTRTVQSLASGTPVHETEECFRLQRNTLHTQDRGDRIELGMRCPRGGGDFTLANDGGCPAHGRVEP